MAGYTDTDRQEVRGHRSDSLMTQGADLSETAQTLLLIQNQKGSLGSTATEHPENRRPLENTWSDLRSLKPNRAVAVLLLH